MAGRATLSDVARLAGVDMSTVSRVLRGEQTQRIRAETRERIEAAARQLSYRPNALARALRTARTQTLGIVVPQLDNPVFAAAIEGAEAAAAALGFSMLIAHHSFGSADSGVYRRLSEGNRIDGLLVASLDADQTLLPELEATGTRFVLFNRLLEGSPHCVVLDSRAAAGMAVDHLAGLGHRRIAHLAGRPGGFNAHERLAGYREGLARHGIAFDPALVATAGYTAEGGVEAMGQLLAQRPSAVLAATLVSAAGAMTVLHEAGLRIPQDVSVVGLHDAAVATMLYPPLTTVRMPTARMGRLATEMLVGLVRGEEPARVPPLAPEALVVRASTAPPSR